nr:hypothetical protein [Tanacetum cinerariifolium]
MERVTDEAIYKVLGDSLVRVTTTASSLEAEQENGNINRTQSKVIPNELSSQGTSSDGGPRCQEAMRDAIAQTSFENVSKLSNDSLLARADAKMFDVDRDLGGEEVFVEQEVVADKEKIDEVTLAQALADLKTSKPKPKGIVIQEQKEPVKPKKKDQIRLDEEVALKLQAEFDEEQRLLKEFKFDKVQEMFDKAFKRVKTFEDFRTELVQGQEKEKRAGEELIQNRAKKQKSLKIVDWKIYKEGKKSYYQIIKADGKSLTYMFFSQMLTSFDREDLEDLYKLVKAKYGSTRPMQDLDLLLWGDLKTMFEPHVEDAIWKKQKGYKVLE